MADIRSKSLAYLRDGKVTVGAARRPKDWGRPDFVSARVLGHTATYFVHLLDGRWSCSCQSEWSDGQACAHVAAVQLVTGWPSAARKEEQVSS